MNPAPLPGGHARLAVKGVNATLGIADHQRFHRAGSNPPAIA